MDIKSSDERGEAKTFFKRHSKELVIALVFAIVAAIGIEWWKGWSNRKAIDNNLKAVATLVVFDRKGIALRQGSGFFINSTGLLVTNAHVIRGMADAHAKLSSGAFYDLQSIKSIDSDVDVAVLQFDAKETPSVSGLGNSDDVHMGEKVFTIGTPIGQEGTVSEGNISNPNRESGGRKFLQFTAPVSPGSSGGGLFNESGDIIGITTSSLTITGGSEGGLAQNLNYAVPINDLKKSMSGASNTNDAVQYYFQGTLAQNKKDWDDAVRFYSRAVELDSLYSDAYSGLAVVYYEKRDYDLELENFLAAARIDSNNGGAFYLLATAFEDVGQYKEAYKAFLRAYYLDPEDKDVLHDFALLNLAFGHKDAASNLIQKLYKLDPGWSGVLESILRKSK